MEEWFWICCTVLTESNVQTKYLVSKNLFFANVLFGVIFNCHKRVTYPRKPPEYTKLKYFIDSYCNSSIRKMKANWFIFKTFFLDALELYNISARCTIAKSKFLKIWNHESMEFALCSRWTKWDWYNSLSCKFQNRYGRLTVDELCRPPTNSYYLRQEQENCGSFK